MRPRRRRLRPLDAALPLPQSESQRPQRRNEEKDAPMATPASKHACVTRRTFLTCALATPAVMAGSRLASAADPVSVGMVNTISDAGFFVAEAKGYFKAAGIEGKFLPLTSAPALIPPPPSGD